MTQFLTLLLRQGLVGLLALTALSVQAQWNSIGSGFTGNNLKVYSLAVVDSNTIWAVPRNSQFSAATPFFTRSLDGGTTWDARNYTAGADLTPIHIFALDADVAWICLTDFNDRDGAGMLKTTDGGVAWTTLSGPFTQAGHNLKAVHFFDANVGVAFGSTGDGAANQDNLRIYRSTDGGSSWAEVSGLPATQAGEGTWTEAGNGGYDAVGDNLWFGSTTGRIWYSNDQGATWQVADAGITGNNLSISSVAFRDASNGLATSETGQVIMTTDGGATWAPTGTQPQAPPSTIGIEYVPGTSGTYVIWDGPFNSRDLSYTNDEGSSWARTNGNFSMDCVVFVDASVGYGGSTVTSDQVGGVYRWQGQAPGVTGLFGQASAPAFELFPNPAQNELHLRWEQAKPRHIEVLDLQGRPVGLGQEVRGEAATLPLNDLVPGFYLLRSQDSEGVQVQRFLVN